MEQQLKQRLVGISVIFALAVIFLPMILDGSGQHLETLDIKIPPPPLVESRVDARQRVIELKREVIALPEIAPTIVDEVADAQAKISEAAETKAAAELPDKTGKAAETKLSSTNRKVQLVPTPVPTAAPQKTAEAPAVQVGGDSWVIQIGSFHDKDKAYAQRDLIRKSGLGAVFIEKFSQDGALSYRVRMGPFLSRDKATVVKNKVLAKYNIKGWLQKYEK